MKTMTKMMVVAIALMFAAALLVAPAAARDTNIEDIKIGDTIYVWETGLNLTGLNSSVPSLTEVKGLRKFVDDEVGKAELNFIAVGTPSSFDVLESDVGSYLGVYYPVFENNQAYDNTSISIRKPSLTADVVLTADKTESVDGKGVTKTTKIQFKVNAPSVGALYKNADDVYGAKVKVEITTPGGAKVTTFGKQDLKNIEVNKTEMFLGEAPYNLPLDLSDETAGTYTAQVKWEYPDGFKDYAPASNTVSFTIETRTVTIDSNKDAVVRTNPFVVTISGESLTNYTVYVQSADTKSPTIRAGQPSVWVNDADAATKLNASGTSFNFVTNTSAMVQTNAAGTRAIEFETDQNTDEKTYTIRVAEYDDLSNYDTVKVKVEKGAITITASGDRTYYIGEEITFSGTNTDSDKVYLFVTGPNLNTNGVKADDPTESTITGNASTFKEVNVESDDTWEWKFDTQGYGVDAGTYTFYAVTDTKNRADLSDAEYETVSIVLRKGFISSSVSSTTVAKGDKLFIRGNAQGNPNDIAVWIVGTNHFERYVESVEDDSSFEFELKSADTKDLAAGQYFVITQHPMGDGDFNVDFNSDDANRVGIVGTNGKGTNGFLHAGTGRLQGSDAAQALIDLLNNQNVDDTYNKLTFLIQEPWIRIDPISDKYIGTTFTISGTTNLGVDNELLVDVKSSAFQPTEKTASGEFSGDAGTVKVVAGDAGYNTWSFEVNAAAFKADEYIVKVESIEADTTTTDTFNVLEGVPPTQPPATTPPTTQPPATTPPTEVPATPASPGFGALVAIAGLGAVAFLVLRRD